MRELKELLILTKKELLKSKGPTKAYNKYSGLCSLISFMSCSGLISHEQYLFLLDFIRESYDKTYMSYPYYWPKYLIKPRIKFLDEYINKLQNNQKLEYFDKAAKYQAGLDMRQEFVVILNESDILTQKIAEDEKDIN